MDVNPEMMNSLNVNRNHHDEIIGLLPAGGQATRIAPLPCSKEIYPIGFRSIGEENDLRPKAVCLYLLENMRLAGASKAYIILRQGKFDIPAYLGDGAMLEMHLAYLMMNLPYGVPYTLDQAYAFVQNALVVFGFPDIIFEPKNTFEQLLSRQSATKADVVLGLFPADQPHKMDMVDLDETGRIRQIVIKPDRTELRYTWIIAVWTPEFTGFMHNYLAAAQKSVTDFADGEKSPPELFVGDVIQAALHAGMQVETVLFPQGTYLDIGTSEDLIKAAQQSLNQVI